MTLLTTARTLAKECRADIKWYSANAETDARRRLLDHFPKIASALDALADECERLAKERDAARADMESAEQRMLCVLDGTFSVGDGTAQREIERLRAENERLRKALGEALDIAERCHGIDCKWGDECRWNASGDIDRLRSILADKEQP